MAKIRVLKFGGTSLGNAKRFKVVANIIVRADPKQSVVVVSAVTGITNALLQLASEAKIEKRRKIARDIRDVHESISAGLSLPLSVCAPLLQELDQLARKRPNTTSKKARDKFVSFGERLSAFILAAYLSHVGVQAKAYPAWEIGMITNDRFGAADPLASTPARIRKFLRKRNVLPVVTGYVGKTKKGEITTLGRGGSDYTAAIIGAALGAEVIQIWKEVDGFMTTDPRLVSKAKVVPELAFEEASELAYFGAKVLHPKAVVPAMKAHVPVQILNTFKPRGAGTMIVSSFKKRKAASQTIDALTFRKNISIIHIFSPEFFDGNKMIADVFDLFGDYGVNIGDIAISVASISVVMDSGDPLPRTLLNKLKGMGEVVIDTDKAMICAVGGSVNTAAVAGRMFSALGKHGIPVEFIAQASSGYSITFIVDEKNAEKTIKILHREYIEKV